MKVEGMPEQFWVVFGAGTVELQYQMVIDG